MSRLALSAVFGHERDEVRRRSGGCSLTELCAGGTVEPPCYVENAPVREGIVDVAHVLGVTQ